MVGRRHYRDPCPVARALDCVGERWALLVVRELLPGPKRFTDLRTQLQGVSPNVLAQRLEELERYEVIERRYLPPPAASHVYELTAWGRELDPIVRALGRFGRRCPPPQDALTPGATSTVLQLESRFDSAAAAGLKFRVALALGLEVYHYRITKKELRPEPLEAADPDLSLACEPATLLELIQGETTLEAALASNALRLSGDAALAQTFCTLFERL